MQDVNPVSGASCHITYDPCLRGQVLGSVTLFLNILACLAHDEPKPHDHTAGRRNVKGAAIGAKFLQFLASLLVQAGRGSGFRVQASGFRVWGLGFRV